MATTSFNVSVEDSHAVLKKVLPLMSQQQVPTIPQNYAIWYDFVSAANDALVAELNERMARGMTFSPDACQRLYEKYFLHELRARVTEIQGAMRNVMDTTLDGLDGLDGELASFGELLDRADEVLDGRSVPDSLTTLLAELVGRTRATRELSAVTGATIRSLAAELDALRVHVDALSRDSRQDALTGVASRRTFDDGLRRMLVEADDAHDPLCLLLVDVDEFAACNERHGRAAADQVLRFVAQEMDQCVKGRDLVARYDGASFAILLPATSYNGALMLAESIRAIIEAQVVVTDDGREIDALTISLGVVQWRSGEDGAALVERCAACLRQAKNTGRNRVTGERDLRG